MNYKEFKSFYESNILLFIILLFVIVYIILNWSLISKGNYFDGEYIKSILITGIIFLIYHMFITWDDNTEEINEDIVIPKYKFPTSKNENITINTAINNPITNLNQDIQQQQIRENIQDTQSLNNKYKIINKFDTNQKFNDFIKNHDNNDPKYSNQNIFVSHKNSSKYGLKF
jgi:hypothetical protein